MNKDDVIDSLGRIDEHVIQKVNNARLKEGHKPSFRRGLSMAACIALVLSIALTAEATNGTVSNLLAPILVERRQRLLTISVFLSVRQLL